MPKPADIGSKRLICLAPNNWVKWVTQIPNVVAREIITSEFQWISRESDVLARAHSPQDGELLVLKVRSRQCNGHCRCYELTSN